MQALKSLLQRPFHSSTGQLRWREWAVQYPYTVVAAIYFFSQAFPAVLKHHSEWTEVYVTASQELLAGRDFLAGPGGYLYPPFFTVPVIPFTFLPTALSQLLWFTICCACLAYWVKKAWYISGGGRLQGPRENVAPKEHLVFLMACLCAARFLQNALSHAQTDLLIAALLMVGFLALRSNRSFAAATWIGVAAAFKCTPLLFAPYLAWRGKWLCAVWLLMVAVGLNFLPDLVHAPPSGSQWATLWYTRYLRPLAKQDSPPGAWHTHMINNQALSGAVNRFFTLDVEWSDKAEGRWFDFDVVDRFFPARTGWTSKGVEFVNRNSMFSTPVLKWFTYLLYALVVLPSAFVLRLRRGKGPPSFKTPDADALEFSIILLLMLLLSPNSSPAHFGIMILPAFCVARIAVMERNRVAWGLLLASMFCTLVSNNFPGLKPLNNLTNWAGMVTLATLLLLAGCILGLVRKSSAKGAVLPVTTQLEE